MLQEHPRVEKIARKIPQVVVDERPQPAFRIGLNFHGLNQGGIEISQAEGLPDDLLKEAFLVAEVVLNRRSSNACHVADFADRYVRKTPGREQVRGDIENFRTRIPVVRSRCDHTYDFPPGHPNSGI